MEIDWQQEAQNYNAGKVTIEQCRRKAKVKRKTARDLLAAHGAKIRKGGSHPVDEQKIVHLYVEEKHSIEAVGAKVGAGKDRVTRILKQHGVTVRAQATKREYIRPGEPETKVCSICGIQQPITEFYRSGKRGRVGKCKSCYLAIKNKSGHVEPENDISIALRGRTGYWNPWADGEIMSPQGVESNSILMCPM